MWEKDNTKKYFKIKFSYKIKNFGLQHQSMIHEWLDSMKGIRMGFPKFHENRRKYGENIQNNTPKISRKYPAARNF